MNPMWKETSRNEIDSFIVILSYNDFACFRRVMIFILQYIHEPHRLLTLGAY